MKTHSSFGSAVALTGFFAVLAGCSGTPQITPAAPGTAIQSVYRAASTYTALPAGPNAEHVQYSAQNPPGPVPERFMMRALTRAAGIRPAAIAFTRQGLAPKKPALNYVFTSDNVTGDINIYDEPTLALIGQGRGYGGWGVAADKNGHICWGTFSNTIACGKVSTSGWSPTAYLNETSGSAMSIAFTSNGDLYATNFGAGTIDHWKSAQIYGCTNCNPASTFTLLQIAYPFFLAADVGKLYVEGDDSTYTNVLVGSPNLKNYKFTEIQSQPTSGFFPGGMAFDKSHTLIWNNQYGTMYALPAPYNTVTGFIEYSNGSNPLAYTAIALDSAEKNVLAANVYTCGSSTCSDAQKNSYPLGSLGIASNSNGDIDDVGIAITPASKN